jgi:hypothetical protein
MHAEKNGKLSRLPEVPSSFSLSPQRGERARVRGEQKKLLRLLQNSQLTTVVILSAAKNLVFSISY